MTNFMKKEMGASKLPKKIHGKAAGNHCCLPLHVDQHLDDILSGKAADMFEIRICRPAIHTPHPPQQHD